MSQLNVDEFRRQVDAMFGGLRKAANNAIVTLNDELHDEVYFNILEGYVTLNWEPITAKYEAQKRKTPGSIMEGHVLFREMLDNLEKENESESNDIHVARTYVKPTGYETIQEFGGGNNVPARPYFRPALEPLEEEWQEKVLEAINDAIE